MTWPHRTRSDRSITSAYEMLGMVGKGQYGQVYCARRINTGELVALKELKLERFPTQNLLRELRYLLTLDHVNITRCDALEHAREGRYLVLEYCEGGTLRDLINQQTPLSYVQILNFIQQILAGLGHAHAQGLIHCDVKPENILLKPTADGWLLKLTDFGIARHQKREQGEITATGSPAYMAPERFYGDFSPASDLYAVGVILYELLVGRRPFSGSPLELMQAHLNQRPELDPLIPEPLRPILDCVLRKLPPRRFNTAVKMTEAIQLAAVALAEPDRCLLGPLLPLYPAPIEKTQLLPPGVSCLLVIESDPIQLVYAISHQIWKVSASKTTDDTDQDMDQIAGIETDLGSLPESVLALHTLPNWKSIWLARTEQTLYSISERALPCALLHIPMPWQYAVASRSAQLAWATADEFGLIQWPSDSPDSLEKEPQQLDALPEFLARSHQFYRWTLDWETGSEPPRLAWMDSDQMLALVTGSSQDQGGQLRLYSLRSNQGKPESFVLPTPAREVVAGLDGNTLLLTDPLKWHRLTWIQVRPWRIKTLLMDSEVTQIFQAAWGFLAITLSGHLILLSGMGDLLARIAVEPGSEVVELQTNGYLWIQRTRENAKPHSAPAPKLELEDIMQASVPSRSELKSKESSYTGTLIQVNLNLLNELSGS